MARLNCCIIAPIESRCSHSLERIKMQHHNLFRTAAGHQKRPGRPQIGDKFGTRKYGRRLPDALISTLAHWLELGVCTSIT
jgi:hypothetical protein